MSKMKDLERVQAWWRWLVLLAFLVCMALVLIQPWEDKEKSASTQNEKAFQQPLETSVENSDGLVRRVPVESTGFALPASNNPPAEAMLTLVSDIGLPIEAVWIRVGGEWRIERLNSPGELALALVVGADLIAPVGHLPERPNHSPSRMTFSPWSTVIIHGVPEEWLDEATARVPSQPLQEVFWQFGSFGDSGNNTWSCLVQPLPHLLDEPNLNLDTKPFSLELLGPNGISLNVELSLVRGTRLVLDYQSVENWVETIDIPISFTEGMPNAPWQVTVVEDGAGQSTLPSPVLVNQKEGVVAHQVLRKRILSFRAGEQPIIRNVRVGSNLTVFASSADSEWYSFQPRFLVGKNPEVVLFLDKGFHLEVTGLSHFGENLEQILVAWRFEEFDGEKGSHQTIRASKVFPFSGNDGSIRFVPSMEQMWRLSKIKPSSLWIHLVLSNGPLFTSTHHVRVPLSRQVQIEVQDVASNGFAVKVGKSPSSLSGTKWASFAIDHDPHRSSNWCNTGASIASIEEGSTANESVLWLVDSSGGPLPQDLVDEMPSLIVLDWPNRSEYFEQNEFGVFQEIETRPFEIDFSSLNSTGSWKVSWCFGCERNSSFPLNFPLTTDVLPQRVVLQVPLRHSHLLVNGERVQNLDMVGPLALILD